jgi:hypothetical protein
MATIQSTIAFIRTTGRTCIQKKAAMSCLQVLCLFDPVVTFLIKKQL